MLIGEAVHPPLMGCASHGMWHLCTVLPHSAAHVPRVGGVWGLHTVAPTHMCVVRRESHERVNNRPECECVNKRKVVQALVHVAGEWSCDLKFY